jgi:putative molybdopterin biosynthesis protein
MLQPKMFTPEQVAEMLQLSKNTVYQLINKGEIIAKRLGKVYRIPAESISYVFTGLDYDLYQAQKEDEKNLKRVEGLLRDVRKSIWKKLRSF